MRRSTRVPPPPRRRTPWGARSPAEVATRATSGFTSAGALLRAARASSPGDPPATRAMLAPVPPPRAPASRGDRSRPFDQWSEDEKAAWRAEKEAKRAAAERIKRARQTSRQGSIVAAMAAAADATRDPNSRAPVADAIARSSGASSPRVPEACLREREPCAARGATPSTMQRSSHSRRWPATRAAHTHGEESRSPPG